MHSFKELLTTKISKKKPLVLVGLGNMGKSMLRGWLKNGVDSQAIRIVTPHPEMEYMDFSGIPSSHFMTDPKNMDDNASAIVLAVKPQNMDIVAPQYIKFAHNKSIFLSIAAGKSLSYFENIYGTDVPIIRCMPNTPGAIGHGISGMIANEVANMEHQNLCTSLMSGLGDVLWFDKEKEDQMNIVTGISGSGPAFIYHYLECIYQTGLKNGLEPDTAMQLANKTVIGSIMLLSKKIEESGGVDNANNLWSTQLREQVTSPNGTTFAGLQKLMNPDSGLQPLMDETIRLAIERSRELNSAPQNKSNE
ncbi:pyrroline-5-carboxylate reductase [Govanella unica]|uniref:Pyrroline-5-carboxylate reductase n=1 Tax=Govanella unica TaxID=2975056 RepID=A0A9X3Z7B8_9PROT|nr:pyrroline-5-carboxylate reductase [Govania unica]MDA5193908.1 pyrroline-5-carboxylate reductase [Govania unica]